MPFRTDLQPEHRDYSLDRYDMYYPKVLNLYRDDYPSRQEYLRQFKDCNNHYGYKVKIEGGWKFFEFIDDLNRWKQQR